MNENNNNKFKIDDDCDYPKDFKYKPDILGLIYFILAMFSLYLSFIIYLLALPVSFTLFILSIINNKKNKTLSTASAIVTAIVAFTISLFILLVNFIIY